MDREVDNSSASTFLRLAPGGWAFPAYRCLEKIPRRGVGVGGTRRAVISGAIEHAVAKTQGALPSSLDLSNFYALSLSAPPRSAFQSSTRHPCEHFLGGLDWIIA